LCGNGSLVVSVLDSSGVSDGVEDEFAKCGGIFIDARNDGLKIEVIWGRSERMREGFKMPVSDSVEWLDPGMGLRLSYGRAGTNSSL
jgi:hypothetical protein